jgi:hypothetical protein
MGDAQQRQGQRAIAAAREDDAHHPRVVGLHPPQEGDAIHPRQLHLGDQHVDWPRAQHLEGLRHRMDEQHVPSLAIRLQQPLDGLEQPRLVVEEENEGPPPFPGRPLLPLLLLLLLQLLQLLLRAGDAGSLHCALRDP